MIRSRTRARTYTQQPTEVREAVAAEGLQDVVLLCSSHPTGPLSPARARRCHGPPLAMAVVVTGDFGRE